MDRESIYRSNNEELAKIHIDTLEYHVRASENYISKIIDSVALEQPDIILRDSCSLFARKIADYLNIPCIGYATSLIVPSSIFFTNPRFAVESSYGYDMSKRSDEEVEELIKLFIGNTKRISEKYNYRYLPLNHQVDPDEEINFSFGLPVIENYDKQKYIFVKPTIFEEDDTHFKKKNNNIYVSSGSVVVFPAHIYKKLVSTLANSSYQVHISFKLLNSGLVKIHNTPDNIYFHHFIDQISQLKNSCVHISHGGYNSLLESIKYEVPLLIIPLQNDEYMDAKIVELNKLGISLSTLMIDSLSHIELLKKINELVLSEEYLFNLKKYKNKLKNMPINCSKLIEIIESKFYEKV